MTAGLLPVLSRLRTRAGLTGIVATGVPAAGLAWGLVELLRSYAPDGTLARTALTVPAAGLAVVATVAIAWSRRPALTDVARDADRRLDLQASVVTAWQFRDATDAFAARTTTRALDGLRAARPGVVYPWRISRAGLVCLAVGAAAVLGGTVGPGAGAPRPGRAEATTGAAGRLAFPAPPGTPGTTADRSAATALPPPQQTPPRGAVPEAAPRPGDNGDAPRPGSRGAGEQTNPDATGALAAAKGQSRGGMSAPGGGRSGGRGASTGNGPTGGSAPPPASTPPAAAANAPGLERVPMNRRAYVRRYLLSRAEPR